MTGYEIRAKARSIASDIQCDTTGAEEYAVCELRKLLGPGQMIRITKKIETDPDDCVAVTYEIWDGYRYATAETLHKAMWRAVGAILRRQAAKTDE